MGRLRTEAKACTQTPGLARECGQFLSRSEQCEGKTGSSFSPVSC